MPWPTRMGMVPSADRETQAVTREPRPAFLWRREALEPVSVLHVLGVAVKRFAVNVPSAYAEGQTLAFFSDLHWPPADSRKILEARSYLNTIGVDWVIFGGDLATHVSASDDALRFV